LLDSEVPDEPFMEELLHDYFPPALRAKYASDIAGHRLRREIIATTLTNGIVNRCGPPTALRLAEEAAQPIKEAAHAFMTIRAVFSLAEVWRRLDALDGEIAGATQLDAYVCIQQVLNRNLAWFLRRTGPRTSLTDTIALYKAGYETVRDVFPEVATARTLQRCQNLERELVESAMPADVASDIARLIVLEDAPAIVDIARVSHRPIDEAARAFLAIGDRFGIDDLLARTAQIKVADDYDRLAIAAAEGTLADARHSMTLAALATGARDASGLEDWAARQPDRILAAEQDLRAIIAARELTVSRLTVAATRLADIVRTQ
jgi:glutamate dehydrogenase